MIEIWRIIPGFDRVYLASSEGRIKRIRTQSCRPTNRILKPDDSSRYLRVTLSLDDKHFRHTVHYLVCLTFKGPKPSSTHEVNHKNGIKRDNSESNLEWVTKSEQHKHRYKVLGQQSPLKTHPKAASWRLKGQLARYGNKDKFGLVSGTRTSAAATLYEKGVTPDFVEQKLGGVFLAMLTKLKKNGHSVIRTGPTIKLTHRDLA